MISFNEKYKKINSEIKDNKKLVEKIYKIAYKNAFDNEGERIDFGVDFSNNCKRIKTYFSVKEKINNVSLGVDVQMYHCRYFPEIFAKMRMLHDFSKGEADICRVYSLLFYKEDKRIRHLGILSEDMSEGGKYGIEDAYWRKGEHGDLLRELFHTKRGESDFTHSRFGVFKKNNKWPREIVRWPIVDLDSKVKVNKKYEKLFNQLSSYYEDNIDDFSLFMDLSPKEKR